MASVTKPMAINLIPPFSVYLQVNPYATKVVMKVRNVIQKYVDESQCAPGYSNLKPKLLKLKLLFLV